MSADVVTFPGERSGQPRRPRVPAGAGKAGKALWRSITEDFDLDEHELSLLQQAVRTADHIDLLDSEVADRGVLVESPQGLKANPAVVEVRQQRLALARLLAALRMPTGDDSTKSTGSRPQRRTGVRGIYGGRR